MVYRVGYERPRDPNDPSPFRRRARTFLDLLAVAHATPVLPLVELSHRIDRSGGRLLGREGDRGWYQRGRSARAFDGFEAAPIVKHEALANAREAFGKRRLLSQVSSNS